MVTNEIDERNSGSLDQKAERIRTIKGNHDSQKSLAKTLEDFYDLSYYHTPEEIADSQYPICVRMKADSNKEGEIPRDLISDLERLGPNRILGIVNGDINELSYDNIRESFYPDDSSEHWYNKLGDKMLTASDIVGAAGMATLFGSFGSFGVNSLTGSNPEYLFDYAFGGMIAGYGAMALGGCMGLASIVGQEIYDGMRTKYSYRKMMRNLPAIVRKRTDAFGQLHANAEEAEDFLRDYESLARRIE